MSLAAKIARVIEAADDRYVFEDYAKQAAAVLTMLRSEGLAIVPATATKAMAAAGCEAIRPGKSRPEDIAAAIWQAMLAEAKRS